ncbi:MAG: hypothetical protein Q8922_00500 [Bacteroidota bacterium]|nr:hypothetical protein [Bacteroidota bacterium]MDP4241648.1 hypothetical protein [Bacteroidota bacterium]MDP4286393.1 hypothetical protein [Bacteroidota bacterium]
MRDVDATWRLLYSNPKNTIAFHAGFFFDEHSGFIGGDGLQGVFKTVDGGLTWTTVPLIPIPISSGGNNPTIEDIWMLDRMHGWLTIEWVAGPGVYETTDGGASWHGTTFIGDAGCVRKTPAALVVTSRSSVNTGGFSTDGGLTFTRLPVLDFTNGVDFVDDFHGVATSYWDTIWSRTTDGGITWIKLPAAYHSETWSVYGVPGTSVFYTAGEGLQNVNSSVNKSTDYGATWPINLKSNLPFRTTGHIGGVADTALYVQVSLVDASSVPRQMFRSTDHGKTWVPVGGPANERDTRFIVLGCRGEVVIAFDDLGNVYKTTDGGDGAFAQSSLSSSSTLLVDSINVCSPRDTIITIENLGCDTIYITNANVPAMPRLDVLDPSGGPPQYPYVILPNQRRSLRLRLYSGFAGAYQTRLIVELLREGVYSYDTVHILSAMRFTNPVYADRKSVAFDSTALCDSRDTTITLANDSCFTVQILNSSIKTGTNFSLVTVIKNDSIPSGGRKTFTIRFNPTELNASHDSLIVNLIILGQPARLAYALSGIGKPDNPKFIMLLGNARTLATSIDFGTKTTCDNDTIIPFLITNPGCTYLNVKVALLDSTKTAAPPATLFKWFVPGGLRKIHNGDTLIGGLKASILQRGTYRGYLRVIDSIDGRPAVTTDLPYTITITNGPKVLALDDTHRDLDTIAFCETKDVLIPFANNSCDTIFFDSLSLAGAGFSLVNPPSVPFMLLPYKSSALMVHFAPVVSGGTSATLALRSDADSAKLRTIHFTAAATPTDTVKLSAIIGRLSVRAGDTSVVSIVPQSTFHNKGINSINVTLEYNGDVMEAIGDPQPGSLLETTTSDPLIIPPVGKLVQLPLHAKGPNLSLDAETPFISQKFRFFVSDSSQTGFRITHVDFNGGDYIFSKCALGDVIDSGTISINFACGDSILYRFMRDGAGFSVNDGIARSTNMPRPNPVTSGEVEIPFLALRSVDAQLSLINETGQEVRSENVSVLQSGMASFSVSTTRLASGVYHYMIRPLDGGRGVASGEFVVMK